MPSHIVGRDRLEALGQVCRRSEGYLESTIRRKGLKMFIGGGLIVLIIIIVLVVLLLRR
jgi:hypothetical protein